MNTATFTQQDIINAQTNAKIDILAQEMKDFKDEMREFKGEMRDFKEEMRDFKREVKESQAEMRSIGKHVQNLTIASMVGIGAMALSGGAIAVAVVYSIFNSVAK